MGADAAFTKKVSYQMLYGMTGAPEQSLLTAMNEIWFYFAAVGAALYAGLNAANRWKRASLSAKREIMDMSTIYRSWYLSRGVSESDFRDIWGEIADALQIPAGLLRPSDKFGNEVGSSARFGSCDLDELSTSAIMRAERFGISVDLSRIVTIDDYVMTFVERDATRKS